MKLDIVLVSEGVACFSLTVYHGMNVAVAWALPGYDEPVTSRANSKSRTSVTNPCRVKSEPDFHPSII